MKFEWELKLKVLRILVLEKVGENVAEEVTPAEKSKRMCPFYLLPENFTLMVESLTE